MLPSNDSNYLADHANNGSHTLASEGNMMCLVFHDFPLPAGFDREKSDLLLRFPSGYPDVPLDMWWFDPPIRRVDGRTIPATEVIEHYLDRSWQRWSRHLPTGQWRSGIDGLESYLALLRRELERSANGAVR